jgi:acetyl esterase/lipase
MIRSALQRAFSLLVVCSAIASTGNCAGADAAFTMRTHVFKTVGECQLRADVYWHEDTVARPVIVWLHGGALVMGGRRGVPKNIVDLCRAEGFALVSLDYRLAPEVKLPAIIEDVQDGFRWIHEQGPKLFHADTRRVVVTGGSAGGYLTMMTGICVQPQPTALVAYWGYGDVDGDWYAKPSEHYRKVAPLFTKADADKARSPVPLTGSETNNAALQARPTYYRYLRQNGLWPKEVTGFDLATEREKFTPFCPVRNLTTSYPPILMVHGTEDTDVPYSKSADMARELARLKLRHELVTVPGAEHGLAGGDKQLVAQAHQRALDFITEHLQAPPR